MKELIKDELINRLKKKFTIIEPQKKESITGTDPDKHIFKYNNAEIKKSR